MNRNSHSTAERKLRSCLHFGPATGAEDAQRCCFAHVVHHLGQWCFGAPSSWDTIPRKYIERVEGHWKENYTGKDAVSAICKLGKETGFPSLWQLQKKARGFCSVICSWMKCSILNMEVLQHSFHCLQRGRSDSPLFPTSLGTVCGKYCWHCGNWDFILLRFCSVLMIRLLSPWSLCRDRKHAWALKHTLKSVKTVWKYISLL